MAKKEENLIIITFLTLIIFISIYVTIINLLPHHPNSKAKDSRIIAAINKTVEIMSNIYSRYANFDDFNCKHKDMVWLCWDIDRNGGKYGKEDGREPIIVHDTLNNSKSVCIYSPLNMRRNLWYCADSEGHIGYTSIDPGTKSYCVEGKSATCPPVSENIP